MQPKTNLPEFQAASFNCPACNAYAQMHWSNLWANQPFSRKLTFSAAYCSHCEEVTIWQTRDPNQSGKSRTGTLVFPKPVEGPPPHHDLPEDCIKDYEEARVIFPYSPRASAALLRLCVQKLCRHLGEPGQNINDDIKSLVSKGLPILTQQSLDSIRVTGNNAVHPGVMSEEDTKELTSSLFNFVNFIVENQITQPKTIQTLFSQLPEGARKAIEKRDAKSS